MIAVFILSIGHGRFIYNFVEWTLFSEHLQLHHFQFENEYKTIMCKAIHANSTTLRNRFKASYRNHSRRRYFVRVMKVIKKESKTFSILFREGACLLLPDSHSVCEKLMKKTFV